MRYTYWFTLVLAFFVFQSTVFSQTSKEVKAKFGKEKLYGTLVTVPDKDAPIVIIIPGSGATDRNGNGGGIMPKSYELLADGLAKNGISSLRYDKLGIGKSVSKVKEEDMRFEDNVYQVVAWIDYLTKKKYKNIILLGHSEGGLSALMAAQKRSVTNVISIAGPGRTIDEILFDQLTEMNEEWSEDLKIILEQFKAGKTVEDLPSSLEFMFRKSVQPYLISWISINPTSEMGKVHVPILVVQGTNDIQVPVEDAKLLVSGNNNMGKLVLIEGMNHILKNAPEDRNENMKTYYNPKLELHGELVPVLIEFIKE